MIGLCVKREFKGAALERVGPPVIDLRMGAKGGNMHGNEPVPPGALVTGRRSSNCLICLYSLSSYWPIKMAISTKTVYSAIVSP